MASSLAQRSLAGTRLTQTAQTQRSSRPRLAVVAMVTKKLNLVDEAWTKGIGTIGYLSEDKEKSAPNMLRQLEKKKVLSSVEKLGLLSAAEKAGLSLSKIEKLGLLSTAERLGLLSLADEVLVTEPGKISSLSLPFIVASIGAAALIPHDNGLEVVLSYTLATVFSGVAFALFVAGFVIKGLQED